MSILTLEIKKEEKENFQSKSGRKKKEKVIEIGKSRRLKKHQPYYLLARSRLLDKCKGTKQEEEEFKTKQSKKCYNNNKPSEKDFHAINPEQHWYDLRCKKTRKRKQIKHFYLILGLNIFSLFNLAIQFPTLQIMFIL